MEERNPRINVEDFQMQSIKIQNRLETNLWITHVNEYFCSKSRLKI